MDRAGEETISNISVGGEDLKWRDWRPWSVGVVTLAGIQPSAKNAERPQFDRVPIVRLPNRDRTLGRTCMSTVVWSQYQKMFRLKCSRKLLSGIHLCRRVVCCVLVWHGACIMSFSSDAGLSQGQTKRQGMKNLNVYSKDKELNHAGFNTQEG